MEDKGKRLALTAWNSEGEIYRLRSSCSAKYRTWARPVLPWVDMTIKSLRSFSASSKICVAGIPASKLLHKASLMCCLIFYRIGKEAAKERAPARYLPEKKKQLTANDR